MHAIGVYLRSSAADWFLSILPDGWTPRCIYCPHAHLIPPRRHAQRFARA
jgi:hypothetical protein